jgi:hypothetical protein
MEKDGPSTIRCGSDSELDMAHLDVSMDARTIKVKEDRSVGNMDSYTFVLLSETLATLHRVY